MRGSLHGRKIMSGGKEEMKRVKRYDTRYCCGNENCYCSDEDMIRESESGEYVKYEDYASELERFREEVAKSHNSLTFSANKIASLESKLAEARKRIAELEGNCDVIKMAEVIAERDSLRLAVEKMREELSQAVDLLRVWSMGIEGEKESFHERVLEFINGLDLRKALALSPSGVKEEGDK